MNKKFNKKPNEGPYVLTDGGNDYFDTDNLPENVVAIVSKESDIVYMITKNASDTGHFANYMTQLMILSSSTRT